MTEGLDLVDRCLTGRVTVDEWAELGARWPVTRTGERTPIPWQVRRAVVIRDGGTCSQCGFDTPLDRIELDHIVPWSAGGPDRSDNLRVRCRSCNQRRSNYVERTEDTRVLPVTYWCDECAVIVRDDARKLFVDAARSEQGRGHECWTCHQTWWDVATTDPGPHGLIVVSTAPTSALAYCAHCRRTGYTRWAL